MTTAPAPFIATVPAAPSCPEPDSTTATLRAPYDSATDASSRSNRRSPSGSVGCRRQRPSGATSRCIRGGHTTTRPAATACPSHAQLTRCGVCLARIDGSTLLSPPRCCCTTTAAGNGAGKSRSTVVRASSPPADASNTTSSTAGRRSWVVILSVFTRGRPCDSGALPLQVHKATPIHFAKRRDASRRAARLSRFAVREPGRTSLYWPHAQSTWEGAPVKIAIVTGDDVFTDDPDQLCAALVARGHEAMTYVRQPAEGNTDRDGRIRSISVGPRAAASAAD